MNSGESTEKQKQLSLQVAPSRIFADEEQFPSLIPHLDRDFQPPHLQTQNDKLRDFWSEAIKVYSKPFQYCPHSAFAVFVMASPFLSNSLKTHVNSVVIYFQHDNYFKYAFSQIFMALYPSLYALYLRFVGTAVGNFFTTSVQLFTANSIVDCLSSDGFESRLFHDTNPERPCLTTIFMRLLLTGLSHIGSYGVNKSHKDFLKHAVLTNSSEPRMAHLFRDIDYVMKSPITCSRILAGLRDPDTVSKLGWIFLNLYYIYVLIQSYNFFYLKLVRCTGRNHLPITKSRQVSLLLLFHYTSSLNYN